MDMRMLTDSSYFLSWAIDGIDVSSIFYVVMSIIILIYVSRHVTKSEWFLYIEFDSELYLIR